MLMDIIRELKEWKKFKRDLRRVPLLFFKKIICIFVKNFIV